MKGHPSGSTGMLLQVGVPLAHNDVSAAHAALQKLNGCFDLAVIILVAVLSKCLSVQSIYYK